MSIYNKLSEARNNIESKYKDKQAIRETLLFVLTKLIVFAFENGDELPKTFALDAIGWSPGALKEFLEKEVGIEIESITWGEYSVYESQFVIKLI